MSCVEFFSVIVTKYPEDEDHAPVLEDQAHARLARAQDVCDGDLILAAFDAASHEADYFNDQYPASGFEFSRSCPCGVCIHLADHPGPVVVLADWGGVCDPHPADALILIIPTEERQLRPPSPERSPVNEPLR
ncbi:hypothetical protein ABT160_04495 [Streptomyces sp. NPDC001941]|uniref:hypothetical protein n=1 Tax=Streptomyces sp. NPDC001941 TaxID=3154659 RepID=UPI0033320E6D